MRIERTKNFFCLPRQDNFFQPAITETEVLYFWPILCSNLPHNN